MSDKVSILIPVFNREKFISDCIQSALEQTFSNFEVIVVDNASTDSTWEICQHFANNDSRVRIYRNEFNIGPVQNWLRCAAEARGNYGKFLFSDDLMFPEFLEITIPYLKNKDVAFVSCAALIGESLQNSSIHYKIPASHELLSVKDYFENLCTNCYPVPYSPGTAIFRMSDIRSNLLITISTNRYHNFSSNGAGPDVLLFALTALKYASVIMLQDPFVFFRAHSGSISVINDSESVTDGYRLAIAWFFKNYVGTKYWYVWIARIWFDEINKRKRIIFPSKYLILYEGSGSMKENLILFIVIIRMIISKIKRKLFLFFD
ncbi:MAG: glycosyltransferase family 2 protein [Ignavibacteria bacterium]|nr:glycosyltransferase family 2 protein [Ignavibacteria bacterium]